jgi:signal transduction histidine kinase
MKSATKERFFWWVLVPALVAVLATLAVLQYRWSAQVSAATRAQMQSNVNTSLTLFRQDMSRELGAVCLEIRSSTAGVETLRPADLSQAIKHWQQTAAHPALVAQVYVWRDSDKASLLHLDTSRDQLESVDWPSDFDRLKQRLKDMVPPPPRSPAFMAPSFEPRRHNGHRHRQTQDRPGGRPPDAFLPWLVDESIPALVSPMRSRGVPGDSSNPSVATWIIVRLNANVLEKEVFPELTHKYFRGANGLDYHVAVRGGVSGTDRVLYSSDSRFAENTNLVPDAALNLFGPFFHRTPTANQGTDQISVTVRGAPNPRSGAPDDRRNQGFDRGVRLEPIQYLPEDPVWEIVVKHQRGSVEAVVNMLHQRNLMLSFGVLALLAATMTLVLVATQRARRLAALQMNFVAGVSHELRTPLAVISSAAENIAHGLISDPKQLARYSASILKQTRQLTHLVEQVLLFASTQQKQGDYPLRAVDIGEVIDAALENTSGMINASGIAVERNLEPGLPPVAADFAALAQCLQNLITNAIKYGGDGRWMGIRAYSVKEEGLIRGVDVTVRDKGIGIPSDEIKHIFEPFYRSPSVAGSSLHGTGLGLPLARTVIEAMRGRLTVESEPGKGSAFTIHLTLASATRLLSEQAATEGISGETAGDFS